MNARPRQPFLTVDIIITRPGRPGRLVLVRRKNTPRGWALPGGFVDYGETLERAAAREAKEETGLDVTGLRQFRAYSEPSRDPRGHSVTMVFAAESTGDPVGGDDAADARFFDAADLPGDIVFDHATIVADFLRAST